MDMSETIDKNVARIHSDPNAVVVHSINSQLLKLLFGDNGCLKGLLLRDRESWIINVLYAQDTRDHSPILRTSSTYHRGCVYDHNSPTGGSVLAIDDTVPLSCICGRSFLDGRPIWLTNSESDLRGDSFAERYYRRFALVDVNTEGENVPLIEIVFPICSRTPGVSRVVGTLNLECFAEQTPALDEALLSLPRESINELMASLLCVHASYLKAAVDLLELQIGFDKINARVPVPYEIDRDACISGATNAHLGALQLFINHHFDDLNAIAGQLKSIQVD